MEKNIKKLTILHSNDMHGDFLAENVDDNLVGGVSMLSGYVEKVRNEEKNTLYCIDSYKWKCVPINKEHCPKDEDLENILKHYKLQTDEKYGRLVVG